VNGSTLSLPQRWAIWFAIEGDLRFLSHHDIMRAMERAAGRAKLPLSFTQGFNPHAKLSLVCPRPVGVAALDDLLVLGLDEPMEEAEIVARLNRCAPPGARFLRARLLAHSRSPQPLRMRCQLPLDAGQQAKVQQRLRELATDDSWPVDRRVPAKPRRPAEVKTVDLRPLVEDIRVDGELLKTVLIRRDSLWARPGEVLRLVCLDERMDLARVVRTEVEYEMQAL
jgi:radical SAM-linked protein